ncbi:DUF4129 domain-containing protein [Halorubrum sp. CBA1125]|uniref:DUF4129 domain-containing protein n=1 Tax=Halorubrum sp. CBA1125 TaxID=2668072 RepID=UPI0012E769F0|nr:DUF4129 domain-containing protein [Halorubrum sp. CBA1125]MUW14041.1 DUF4129 domain-containing protein [Halorubrum sp. CBA1125]
MKDTTRSGGLAVLAVLAVAFAAATLDSTIVPESDAPSSLAGSGESEEGGLIPLPQANATPGESLQVSVPTEILTVLAVIVALVFVVYVIFYWRDALGLLLAGAVMFGVLFVLFGVLYPAATPIRPPMVEPGNGSIFGGRGGGTDPTQTAPPSLLFLLVLGLALVGAAVALRKTTAEDGDDTATEFDDDETADAAAVGRAAGRAADRLEEEKEAETDVDNEVYRTWREMTDLLAVEDPETSTPGEFAAAAVEAGLGREDVTELTRLFEDVRYGNHRPSDEHERRALTVFRRIEERYAEADS